MNGSNKKQKSRVSTETDGGRKHENMPLQRDFNKTPTERKEDLMGANSFLNYQILGKENSNMKSIQQSVNLGVRKSSYLSSNAVI